MKYITRDDAISISKYMAKKFASIGITDIAIDVNGDIIITYADGSTSTISGDVFMAKATYDTYNRGKVDLAQDSEKLNNQSATYYTNSANIGYDGTISGLTSTMVKTAIDEITAIVNANANKLAGIQAGAEVNVNADWNAVSGDAQILNKPTIPTIPTPRLSAGLTALPTYTDNGNGTVTIGSANANLYPNVDFTGDIVNKTVTGGSFTPSNNSNSYLVVNYNSGNAIYQLITNIDLINESTIIPVYTFYRTDNIIHVLDWDETGIGLSNKTHKRLVKTERFARESGLTLSELATRKILISSGIAWYGAVDINMLACDSSVVGSTLLHYHLNSLWTSSAITQYNNLQYDDGTNLITSNNGRYVVNWIYRGIESANYVHVVLGTTSYGNLASAQTSTIPADLPNIVKSQCILVGRIIVLKNATTASAVESAFVRTFASTTVIEHNDLSNIQGGTTNEYYHLTNAEALSIPNKLDKATFEKLNRFGFTSLAETTIAFDGVNTFTLARTGATFSYFRSGVLNTISTNKTVTLSATPPATTGLYYIFIDDNIGTLTASITPWNLNDTKVPIATIYWNNTLTPKFQMSEERHTCLWDRSVHRYEHLTSGTQLINGSDLTGYTLNSSTDANKTFGISQATIADEDLFQTLTALIDPNGATASYINVYRTSPTNWVWNESFMPFKYTTTGFIEYDNNGVMTPITNNRFANTYLLLSNIQGSARFIFVSGRGTFANTATAYAESFNSFNMTGFITSEAVALYQLTWAGTNNAGVGQCQLNRVQKITSNLVSTTTNIITDHNGLGSLQGGTIGEYFHVTSAQHAELLKNRVDSEAFWVLMGSPPLLIVGTDYQKVINTDTVKIPTSLTNYFTIDANKQDFTCLKTGVIKITRSVTVASTNHNAQLFLIPTINTIQTAECSIQEAQRYIKQNETKGVEYSFYLPVVANDIVSLWVKSDILTEITYGTTRTTIEYISVTN